MRSFFISEKSRSSNNKNRTPPKKNDKEKNYIMSKKGFFNKIKLMQMIMPTSIHDQIISKTKKVNITLI